MYGFIAAGYTTLTCYVIYSLGHYIVSRLVLKECLNGVELYDKRFILGLSIVMIIVGVGCNLLFDLWFIRYALLVLICTIAYIKRNEVIGLIKGIRER